jgi:spermidine/putrescine-binding protein
VSADDSVTKAKDRAGDIDPLLVDGTTFPRLAAIKALAELGDVPNLARVAAQHKGNAWDPDDTFFAPTDHGRTGIIYRRNPLSEQIESWADFVAAAPSHRGRWWCPASGGATTSAPPSWRRRC